MNNNPHCKTYLRYKEPLNLMGCFRSVLVKLTTIMADPQAGEPLPKPLSVCSCSCPCSKCPGESKVEESPEGSPVIKRSVALSAPLTKQDLLLVPAEIHADSTGTPNTRKKGVAVQDPEKNSAGSGTPDTSPLKGDQAAPDCMQVDAEERNLTESDALGKPKPDFPKLKRSTRADHQSQP